jgi:steroid delta-isomerase-like uncharacterized protein
MSARTLLANLRLRLVLLVLLGVLPALGLLFYSASEQRTQAVNTAEAEARRLVQVTAADQERLLESAQYLLAVLARVPAIRDANGTDCDALLTALVADEPLYANLGVIALDGTVRCSALPVDDGVNLRDRAYFQRTVETGTFAVGQFQIGRITHQATINVGYPLLEEPDTVVGVLFAALDLASLNALITDIALPEGSSLLILDRSGTVLVRHPDPEGIVGQSVRGTPVIDQILTGGAGVTEGPGPDDEDYLYASTPLLGPDGAVRAYAVLAQPTAQVLAPANEAFRRHLGRLGVVSILALVAAWVGGDVLARHGSENHKRVVRHLYEAVTTGRTDELGDLFAPDYVDHHPAAGQPPGIAGVREVIRQFRAAFPDGTLTVDDLVADGGTVVAWLTLTGTQAEEFFGVPPTGERVQATGIERFRLAGGRIVESWSSFTALAPAPDPEVPVVSPEHPASTADVSRRPHAAQTR